MVPEARLDFIDFETDLDEALGDLPTGLVEYGLFARRFFEPDEVIKGLSDGGYEERVGELKENASLSSLCLRRGISLAS